MLIKKSKLCWIKKTEKVFHFLISLILLAWKITWFKANERKYRGIFKVKSREKALTPFSSLFKYGNKCRRRCTALCGFLLASCIYVENYQITWSLWVWKFLNAICKTASCNMISIESVVLNILYDNLYKSNGLANYVSNLILVHTTPGRINIL